MDKENLQVVTRCYFRESKDITVNEEGDIPKIDNIENITPDSTILIGVYSDTNMAKSYLNDKCVVNHSSFGEEDSSGWGCPYYYRVSGYYHKIEEQELRTIVIQGQKYAEVNGSFIAINKEVKLMELEKPHKNLNNASELID